ncbi:MAG: hypothetical protein OEW77_05820 [Gemmatimonadota bacterium]|nr:hypothetical protein [Gemmatimonadota bacterium]
MISLLLALQVAAAPAGTPQVSARVTPESPAVGEPIVVELRVRAPAGSEVRFPPVPDSADAIEPLDPRLVRDASSPSVLDRTAVYRLIAWDTGSRALKFGDITVSRDGAARSYPVTLPSVRVRSLLPADSAQRVPREARPLLAIPGGWWRLWVALAVILGLGAWAWRSWRRRVARAAAEPPDAARVAEEGFAHAERLGLLEAGEPGRYALAHVEVMRRYLATRFPQADASRTAREVADALTGAEFPILPQRVADLLLASEPIAFARAPVTTDGARAIAVEARAIVGDVETAWRTRRAAAAKKPRKGRR